MLVGLVVVTGMLGVGLAAAADRLDSALLFVGVPCLLGLGVGLIRTRGGAGSVFQAVTLVLLLAAALLHEGAICVLLAAPLVYGAAFAFYGVSRIGSQRHALAPVLLLVALEGVVPGLRVDPVQQARADLVVAENCAEFEAALARGPHFEEGDRGALLGLAGYPTPDAATGSGLEPDDGWRVVMPIGAIDTRVVGSGTGRLVFEVEDDTAATRRWVDLRGGVLTWTATDEGCRADLAVDYERRLDPSLWFGPLTDLFMEAGADTFLRGLD